MVDTLGDPGITYYVGPGVDWWNLPGTIIGLIEWIAGAFYSNKKYRMQ